MYRATIMGVILCVLVLMMLTHPVVAQSPPADTSGALTKLDMLTGRIWEARGDGFRSTLHYEWSLDNHLLNVTNELKDLDGSVFLRYEGAYMWDPAIDQIVFWTVSGTGELHRGQARWEDGVLWHEAEISGGSSSRYTSALRPESDRFEFFMATGTRQAGPELLKETPLVYEPIDSSADSLTGEKFVVLLRLRHDLWYKYQETGEWPDDPEANEALRGHVAYWREQFDKGHVIMTGGMGGDFWDNVALIVLNAPDLESAERMVSADPAVQTYIFKTQVRPFTVHRIAR